ncbi:MAG: methionine--tRNA ligase [Rhodobacteraceae bacterium]|nr:methionine--tRNA ligase [Paracoccaceae bacterium]
MARHLITSAIPYINGIKHLGNLVGSQLPADLYARYQRARGHEVLFLCATDEHGTPAELAAARAGQPVAEFCAHMHKVQAELAQGFRLSFDYFGRSSSAQNHALTQHFAARLADAGLIREVEENQVYSITDGRFLPDRYIEGTCPACGYAGARGDQCENCTKQLDPVDLIAPRSVLSGSDALEVRATRHLYLRQSLLRARLTEWIDSKTDWPLLTTSIAKKWLNDGEGLQDRGITRDLDWGVPVQRDGKLWPGMEGKVFYVWFDAPIEYIACAAEWAAAHGKDEAEWLRWWRTDKGAEDLRYTQFMGKDNVPFHTLSFPATILGANEPWKLVDYIKAFNYLNYDGGQFSTSRGRGVFMDQALEILPADYWRWWLLAHAPESSDSAFTWEGFQTCVNKDLADVLGNFVSRVVKFCQNRFGDAVPEGGTWGAEEQSLIERLDALLRRYEESMEAIEVRKSARALRMIWASGNEYLQEVAPWATIKHDRHRAAAQIRLALNLVRFYGVLSAPFLPDSSAALLENLGSSKARWPSDVASALTALPAGHAFTSPGVMFRKISDEERIRWQAQFAGPTGAAGEAHSSGARPAT